MARSNKSKNIHFSKFARQIVKDYVNRGKWTPEELKVKDCLVSMGFEYGKDFLHNFRIKQPSGYFWLDFLLLRFNLVIEINSFWHTLGNGPLRGLRRKRFLRKQGLKVIELHVKDIQKLNNDNLRSKLEKILHHMREGRKKSFSNPL